jgi:NAD(P)-dependent dehydrogenase (short-subunit alcohol dehydrogenase family)
MTAFATDTQEKAAKVGARVPPGRNGAPGDIAGATLYLCGRAGSFVTGHPAHRRRAVGAAQREALQGLSAADRGSMEREACVRKR